MRYLFKLRPLNSICVSKFQTFGLSSLSKASKLHNSKKSGETHQKNQTETQNFDSLFHDITEILGAGNLMLDDRSSAFSVSKETHLKDTEEKEEYPCCVQRVCENAKDNVELGKADALVLEATQLKNMGVSDVSPIVHKVTEIVRAEDSAVSMEVRLGSAGFEFDTEIVDKVLKRCFKVPHLALKFFNWVKLNKGFCLTTEAFNTMIYIAVEAKDFGLVEELVEEMEKNSCEKDIKTWTILISYFGNAKLVGKALLIFEKMRRSGFEPDEVTYKLMIRLLCTAEKAEIAMEFYREMIHKNMGLNMRLYILLLRSLAKSGDIASVQFVANQMIEVFKIPEHDVYASVLKSFCIAGRIREALELIRYLNDKNIILDPGNFETLVKGLCRADRIADALEIIDVMKKKTAVDGNIYRIVINGYLRRNDIDKAFDMFQSIKESGQLPATSTYTELMQHLFRLNEYQKACKLYDEMLEKGVKLDSVAITAMVAGHICQNCIPEAWEVFNSMEEKGIKVTRKSYSIFIKELCKISRTDEIFKVLDKMLASKITIGENIFHLIKSYFEKKGEMEMIDKVKQMRRACKHNPQEGEVFRKDVSIGGELNTELSSNRIEPRRVDFQVVEPLSKPYRKQDLEEICRILSSSRGWCLIQEALEKCTIQFTPELVVEILRNCSLHGHSALCFFSWLGEQAGYSHTTETYNMAIKIAGRGKDFKHMRSLFYEMRRKGCLYTSDTWTIMIMQYGRIGMTEIALRNFKEMKDSGCKPNSSTYKCLIISLCGRKGRKVEEGIKMFQEMIQMGCIPDKELVETYFDCLCEVGKLSDARRCTESLRKVGFTIPLSYSLYIRALCRAGRLEEALSLLDEVGPERSSVERYVSGSLVHGLLKKGRLEEALAKVESMKQVGISPTVHVYTSIIGHFLKEKQVSKALEIFEKMKGEGCKPTIVTYSVLICGYVILGKIVDAWNVFQHIKLKGPVPDFKTYSMFISCLSGVGKSEEALQLISEMLDSGIIPSSVNFQTVFYGLNREGKQDLAHTVLQKKWALASRRKFST
ncbi:putative pentatricopeptide repeat-containing protein At5g06400, mitochondrial [Cornus florida]|uniref:putative pentatricopeptide repeat-containing protein At5g06400, mitochondrial n=1 Tax=Cornus florida TaxID=4283 RepID=UPI00289A8080|nr:putative pentatricopeptide repeat-containing protein At5g06400, mitochondrial [Cornus florida]